MSEDLNALIQGLSRSADEYVSGLFAKAFATEGMKVIPELIRRKERGPGTQTCSPIRKYEHGVSFGGVLRATELNYSLKTHINKISAGLFEINEVTWSGLYLPQKVTSANVRVRNYFTAKKHSTQSYSYKRLGRIVAEETHGPEYRTAAWHDS
ncbi:hypothetical protein BJV77DRAFT_1153000 [Russula vinacea]|nr:hypothetical protein BJV77DRAFT_1153000 [Russula vinacea]